MVNCTMMKPHEPMLRATTSATRPGGKGVLVKRVDVVHGCVVVLGFVDPPDADGLERSQRHATGLACGY